MALDLAHRLLAIRMSMLPLPFPATHETIALLKTLYSKEEAWLVGLMPNAPATAKRIASLQRKDPETVERMLLDLSERGLVFDYTKRGEQKFGIQFGESLISTQYKLGEDSPLKRKIARMNVSAYKRKELIEGELERMGAFWTRILPVEKAISSEQKVFQYEDAREMIRGARRFAIGSCVCRKEKHLAGEKVCNNPVDICMFFDFLADYMIRHDFCKEVDQDTMLHQLDEAEKHNLAHMTDNAQQNYLTLCHCCGCCCAAFGALNSVKHKVRPPVSSLVKEWNGEKCTHCGECAEACQVKAVSLIDKTLRYSLERCIGCGLCVRACPNEAVSLVPRQDWVEPNLTYGDMMSDMMTRRIRANIRLPLKKLPGQGRTAREINKIFSSNT
jgi:NAD-dependent dihydropyrimidine dehydrogenase PreA subunit